MANLALKAAAGLWLVVAAIILLPLLAIAVAVFLFALLTAWAIVTVGWVPPPAKDDKKKRPPAEGVAVAADRPPPPNPPLTAMAIPDDWYDEPK